jgi:hypothetical protein
MTTTITPHKLGIGSELALACDYHLREPSVVVTNPVAVLCGRAWRIMRP